MKGVLVIVPCGDAKIWRRDPSRGPTPTRHAYIGAPFIVNKEYAEHFAEMWVVLSAKHGFIDPDFLIPESYNVSFKKSSTKPVTLSILQEQIRARNVARFKVVIGLGGKDYRVVVKRVFTGFDVELFFPFAGLPLFKSMQATKRAIKEGQPFPHPDPRFHSLLRRMNFPVECTVEQVWSP